MKNLFKLFPLLIPLIGCTSNSESMIQIKNYLSILSVTGAPAVAFYNYADKPYFETNSNAAQGILPQMIGNSKDVVILPTNVGIQSIVNKNLKYTIAATITFGNIYVASTGNDDNGVMDDGDYIILFQQGSVPDLLFKYIYEDSLSSNIHYVSDASEAAKCLKSGKNIASNNEKVDYVLVAQPVLQNILNTTETVSIYSDLKQEYEVKSNGMEFFQASIFISDFARKTLVDSFLSSLEQDINNGLKDTNLIKNGLEKSENVNVQYGVPGAQLVKQVLDNNNGLGLGFKRALENKESIDNFLSLFNIGETSESIYYK